VKKRVVHHSEAVDFSPSEIDKAVISVAEPSNGVPPCSKECAEKQQTEWTWEDSST